jgi:hypothetical protein
MAKVLEQRPRRRVEQPAKLDDGEEILVGLGDGDLEARRGRQRT